MLLYFSHLEIARDRTSILSKSNPSNASLTEESAAGYHMRGRADGRDCVVQPVQLARRESAGLLDKDLARSGVERAPRKGRERIRVLLQ